MLKYLRHQFYLRWWLVTFLIHDELEQIPFRYRLLVNMLLKLPNPNLPFFILKRFPEFEGIFWAVVVPILLGLYTWFNVWLFPFLTQHFSFPLNIIFGFTIPAVIFVFFLRIQIERAILLQRNIHRPLKEWDISKTVEEWIQLLKKHQRRKKS